MINTKANNTTKTTQIDQYLNKLLANWLKTLKKVDLILQHDQN